MTMTDRYWLTVDEQTGKERRHSERPSFAKFLHVEVDRENGIETTNTWDHVCNPGGEFEPSKPRGRGWKLIGRARGMSTWQREI
jgi:hypothetical protein